MWQAGHKPGQRQRETNVNYYRIYLKGLHVGIGVRAERMDIDETSLFFWGPGGMVASFWMTDVESIRDIAGRAMDMAVTVAA